jgi:Tol biopolymer transport system component
MRQGSSYRFTTRDGGIFARLELGRKHFGGCTARRRPSTLLPLDMCMGRGTLTKGAPPARGRRSCKAGGTMKTYRAIASMFAVTAVVSAGGVAAVGVPGPVSIAEAAPATTSIRPLNGRITFGRFDPQLGDVSIWAANSDGSHQQRLTHVPSSFSDWSPNGRRIAFDFFDDVGQHVATMGPDGRQVRQLTFGHGIQEVPKWSPEGRWMAFDASPLLPEEPGFATSIWIMRADGSGARQLTHGGFDVEPVFSPDGAQIAFGRITGVNPEGVQQEALYVMNTDGSGLHEIAPAHLGVAHPDWSPDGHWIAFTTEPGGPESILVVRPNGRGLRILRAATKNLQFYKPIWSPDGRQMLVGCNDLHTHVDKICVMSTWGGNVRVVVDTTPYDANFPAWGSHPLE